MTWIKQPRPLAFGVLIAGLAIATAAGIAQRSVNDAFARTRFEELAHRAASQVHSHLHVYAYGLYGARGAIVATGVDGINRERFRQYAASRSFEREFPGALGFGFIRRVPVAEEDDYVARARRDGAPDFTLRPPAPSSAERAVIQYLEP
ncbi:MAG: CHASE domain-containing protein, partial [Polyangiales bacterium]